MLLSVALLFFFSAQKIMTGKPFKYCIKLFIFIFIIECDAKLPMVYEWRKMHLLNARRKYSENIIKVKIPSKSSFLFSLLYKILFKNIFLISTIIYWSVHLNILSSFTKKEMPLLKLINTHKKHLIFVVFHSVQILK